MCAEGGKEVVYKTGKKRENEMEKRSDDSLQLLETMFLFAFYRPMSTFVIWSEMASEVINHTHLWTELTV